MAALAKNLALFLGVWLVVFAGMFAVMQALPDDPYAHFSTSYLKAALVDSSAYDDAANDEDTSYDELRAAVVRRLLARDPPDAAHRDGACQRSDAD